MFQDLNVLYRAKEALRDDPDHERADAARWQGCVDWPEAQYEAAVEALQAYMFSRLDHWQRSTRNATQNEKPPSELWHAPVTEHLQQQQQEHRQQ